MVVALDLVPRGPDNADQPTSCSTSQAAMRYQHAAQDRDAIIAQKLSEMIELAAKLSPEEHQAR
jgi:hypothetical protein